MLSPSRWGRSSRTGLLVRLLLPTFLQDSKLNLSTPDVYCYACDDARIDLDLQKHLATFGIEVADQKKTEKSMTELVRRPFPSPRIGF